MITRNNVYQLKKYLEDTLVICNQMIQTREINKLFTCDKDYRDSKIACKIVPDEFYKIRLFDTEISLCYNSRTKQYFIKIDTHNDLPFSVSEVNKKFKNGFEKINFDGYIRLTIEKDLQFEKIIILFEEFVRWYLYLINKNNIGLFEDIY